MKKSIIATGISGLVGSRIAKLLQFKYNFINFSLDQGIDITDKSNLTYKFEQNLSAESVIHMAAFTNTTEAWNQKEDKKGSCYKVNVTGSKNIAQLCKKYNKYLIHFSTDYVFDGRKSIKYYYTEVEKPNPIEWYGKTKFLAEQEVIKSKCSYVILRIGFPFKSKPESCNLEPVIKLDLIRNIINKLKNQEKMDMFNDRIITPTFIDDIALVVDKILTKKPEGIFHCYGSTSLSHFALAGKVAKVFNLDKKLIIKSQLADYLKSHSNNRPLQKNLSMSNKKVQKELGIKMLTIEESLRVMKKQLEE